MMIVDFDELIFSYDKFISTTKALADQYHDILQCVTIGKSHDNRDILLLKLGLGNNYMVCCAGVHARETINPIVLLRIIEFYAEIFKTYKTEKQDLKNQLLNTTLYLENEYQQMLFQTCTYELLQTFTILFIPLLNPDGYMISLYGYNAIKNPQLRSRIKKMGINYAEWKFNGRGIDINRNFPSRTWKPKGPGDYAASENETKCLIQVFHQYRIRCFLDFHSRGKFIYYYRNSMPSVYNDNQLRIAKRLKDITKYGLAAPEEEIEYGDSGGNTVHYFSERFNKPAFTIETVDEDAPFPLDYTYRASTYEELKLLLFELGGLSL